MQPHSRPTPSFVGHVLVVVCGLSGCLDESKSPSSAVPTSEVPLSAVVQAVEPAPAEGKTLYSSEQNSLNAPAMSPDGRLIAWSTGKTITLYAPAEGRAVATIPDDDRVAALAFTPDGKDLLCFDGYQAKAWNIATNKWAETPLDFDGYEAHFARGKEDVLFTLQTNEILEYRWSDRKLIRQWHTGQATNGFAVSADAKWLVTYGQQDERVFLWDVTTAEPVAKFKADEYGVIAAAFSADGARLITSGNRSLKIWSVADRRLRAVLPLEKLHTNAILLPRDGTTFFCTHHQEYPREYSLRQWDLNELLRRLPEPPPPSDVEPPPTAGVFLHEVKSTRNQPAGFLDGGRSFFSLVEEKHVTVFDTASRKPQWSLEIGPAKWLEFSPDGLLFAASFHSPDAWKVTDNPRPAEVKIWDARTRQLRNTLTLSSTVPEEVCFSPDGKTLAVASGTIGYERPSELTLWDVASGKRTQQIPSDTGRLLHVRYSPDGKALAFDGFGESVIVWDLVAGKQRWRRELLDTAGDLKFSPDGRLLAICGDGYEPKEGFLHLLDTASGEPRPLHGDVRETTFAVSFTPDGRTLVTAGVIPEMPNEGFRFWNLADGKPTRRLVPDYGTGRSRGTMCFSPDDRLFLENVGDDLKLWPMRDLLDDEFRRQIATAREQKVQVAYRDDRLTLEFGHYQANDRSLAELPTISQPFMLIIGYSPPVTDAGLVHLARQKHLRRLDLTHTQATAAGIARLKQSLPMLEVVGP